MDRIDTRRDIGSPVGNPHEVSAATRGRVAQLTGKAAGKRSRVVFRKISLGTLDQPRCDVSLCERDRMEDRGNTAVDRQPLRTNLMRETKATAVTIQRFQIRSMQDGVLLCFFSRANLENFYLVTRRLIFA
jgi:hypothetical protein